MDNNHDSCPHPNTPEWNEACTRVTNGDDPETGIYENLSLKTIHLLYNHFPDHSKVDFIKVLESLAYGYFCTLASQIDHNPQFSKKLDPLKIDLLVRTTVNGLGAVLAAEGIAMPRVARSTMP